MLLSVSNTSGMTDCLSKGANQSTVPMSENVFPSLSLSKYVVAVVLYCNCNLHYVTLQSIQKIMGMRFQVSTKNTAANANATVRSLKFLKSHAFLWFILSFLVLQLREEKTVINPLWEPAHVGIPIKCLNLFSRHNLTRRISSEYQCI